MNPQTITIARAMIAAPFAVDPSNLPASTRALWRSDVLQELIAESMARRARKDGHMGRLPPTIKEPHQNGGFRAFAQKAGPARILEIITGEWESSRSIMAKIGGQRANTHQSLRTLVLSGQVECRPRVGRTVALYRRAQA